MLLRVVPDPAPRPPVQHSLARPACPRFSVVSCSATATSSSGTGCGRMSFRIEFAMAFTSSYPIVCAAHGGSRRESHAIVLRVPSSYSAHSARGTLQRRARKRGPATGVAGRGARTVAREEQANSTREAHATGSVGESLRRGEVTANQRINSLNTCDRRRSGSRRRSTCGLRCCPCTHHSLKCSQLLLSRR